MKLYSAEDIAEIFGCSLETVWRKSRTLEWPHMRLGRRFRYSEEDIRKIQELLRPRPVQAAKTKRIPL
ncbi:helix-turn-helix domain-containing protein [Glutamicibacter protophormiae]|nr:helix-turn-helix domain-containing protein [Glutamicibacter protophormiae]